MSMLLDRCATENVRAVLATPQVHTNPATLHPFINRKG
jgi:hypothetical protein